MVLEVGGGPAVVPRRFRWSDRGRFPLRTGLYLLLAGTWMMLIAHLYGLTLHDLFGTFTTKAQIPKKDFSGNQIYSYTRGTTDSSC